MSISELGASGGLAALLQSTMRQSDDAQAASFTAESEDQTSSAADTQLSGSGKGDLSSDILRLLTMLQSDAQSDTAAADGETADETASDPVASLFSALDEDGDGAVTESELESYITGLGGTADQASALFASLDSSGSGSLGESDLDAAMGPPPPPPQGVEATDSDETESSDGTSGAASSSSEDETTTEAADSNEDGTVTLAEYQAYYGDRPMMGPPPMSEA